VHLLGSGAIVREVIAAAELLATDWQIASAVWSVTSFSELAREAREVERYNRLHPEEPARTSYVARCLAESLPIIAASDYVVAYPQLISAYIHQRFVALGTDGFGRSDTRSALRRFFEVDRHHIVVAALHALSNDNQIPAATVSAALERYGVYADVHPPWTL
jgi:pyruvate dehydrogenase E1 component